MQDDPLADLIAATRTDERCSSCGLPLFRTFHHKHGEIFACECGWWRLARKEEYDMTRIDGKYHIEDNRIIKTGNGEPIPPDEPLILFRARDKHALEALRFYRAVCRERLCTEHQIQAITSVILKFQKFKQDHPERMKEPGVTLGC